MPSGHTHDGRRRPAAQDPLSLRIKKSRKRPRAKHSCAAKRKSESKNNKKYRLYLLFPLLGVAARTEPDSALQSVHDSRAETSSPALWSAEFPSGCSAAFLSLPRRCFARLARTERKARRALEEWPPLDVSKRSPPPCSFRFSREANGTSLRRVQGPRCFFST